MGGNMKTIGFKMTDLLADPSAPVAGMAAVQEIAPDRISERFENRIH